MCVCVCVCVYIYIYINFVCHVQMPKYMHKKPRHLFIKSYYSISSNLQRLNKITKSVKSINLKTN